MLGVLTRRSSLVPKGLPRGYLTHSRQQKDEWWAVDGEIFKADEFDPKQVLEPSPNLQVSNKRRRAERLRRLALTRLKLKIDGQESFWTSYMQRYQTMRDEWEKLVWDPIPLPEPKVRNASLRRKDAEKYVWRDSRRDSYDFQDSRFARRLGPLSASKFDNKAAFRGKGMEHRTYESPRDTGIANNRSGAPYQPYKNRWAYPDSGGVYQPHRNRGAYQESERPGGAYQPYGGRYENEDRSRGTYQAYRNRGPYQNEERSGSSYQPYINRGHHQNEDDDRSGDAHQPYRSRGAYRSEEKSEGGHRNREPFKDEDDQYEF